MPQNQVRILTTGGTIEKSYNEMDGSLKNRQSFLKNRLLSRLRLPHTQVTLRELMAKDSLHMTDEDRLKIWQNIEEEFAHQSPIVILHGTDTMEKSAEYCQSQCPTPPVAVVFTGAMKPMGFEDSDAAQNFIEALIACQLLSPGFYISFHNHVFKVPHVQKNKRRRTFEEKK